MESEKSRGCGPAGVAGVHAASSRSSRDAEKGMLLVVHRHAMACSPVSTDIREIPKISTLEVARPPPQQAVSLAWLSAGTKKPAKGGRDFEDPIQFKNRNRSGPALGRHFFDIGRDIGKKNNNVGFGKPTRKAGMAFLPLVTLGGDWLPHDQWCNRAGKASKLLLQGATRIHQFAASHVQPRIAEKSCHHGRYPSASFGLHRRGGQDRERKS